MPAILALLKTEATSRPNASSLAAKISSSTSSSSGSEARKKDAQQTAVTARQIIVSMTAYVIIHAAQGTQLALRANSRRAPVHRAGYKTGPHWG